MRDRQQRWAWTHRYAMPMFVSSLVAVLLAGSGLIAAMTFFRDGGGSEGNGSGSDGCVVGTWQVVSYTEDGQLGSAEMVEGEPVFAFREDGTGLADFGDATTMAAEVFGVREEAEISGQITYRYETSDQSFEFVGQDSQARFSSDSDILDLGDDIPFTLPTGPVDYTCDGDAMTISGGGQSFEYQRTDS